MAAPSVDKIIEAYRRFSKIPTPTKGYVATRISGVFQAFIFQSQRDLERSENIRSVKNYTLDFNTLKIVSSEQALDVTNEQARCETETACGKKRAILRKISTKTEDKQYLEVWENSIKTLNVDLKTVACHGKVYEDDQFGSLQWSPDGKKIVYVAEKKQPKSESYFKCMRYTDDALESPTAAIPGNENLYMQDWGEALVGKHQPIPVIIDVINNIIKPIDNLPNDVSFGQAVWTPDSSGIVCVGWNQEPRRLGITYCSNRKSALYHYVLEDNSYKVIGSTDKSVNSPRFSLNGLKLVYLESEAGGPHHKGSRLMMCDWNSKEVDVVVDLVWNGSADTFPGIYTKLLPDRIWSNDNERIFFHSVWHSKEELICVNVFTKQVSCLQSNFTEYSWRFFDIQDDVLLATMSTPCQKPVSVLGRLPSSGEKNINWIMLDVPELIPDLEWNVLKFNPAENSVHQKYPSLQYEAILITPTFFEMAKKDISLIVWPHGGPHGVHLTTYNFYASVFAHLGFASLLINYRGSEGFGEDSIYSLLGNIGDYDVKDCQNAVEEVSRTTKFDSFVVFGGSHGGFLAAHLIGQYPHFYKACAMRNPVFDISGKLVVSDIPDWNWVESGFEYDFLTVTKPTDLLTMWEKSPIKYIDNVKTPVLLLLGKLDLRVPPSQGLLCYHALKARNVPTKLCFYEDNHSLSKVDVEADVFVNTVSWFTQYLRK